MATNKDSSFSNLRKWMICQGYHSPDKLLRVAKFSDTGRGLQAERDIRIGETLISIPKRLLITTETVLSGRLGSYISGLKNRLSPMQTLSVFLIVESCLDSDWKPYLDVLPNEYSTPAYYSSSYIQFFAGNVRKRIAEQKLSLKLAYEQLRPFLDRLLIQFQLPDSAVRFERFRWAWFTVNTRCVFMDQPSSPFLNRERDCYALAPFLDLFNHSCDTQVRAGFNVSNNAYEIVTLKEVGRGEQIFINYGFHDNETLLIEYGFVLPTNIHSRVTFTPEDVCSAILEIAQNTSELKKALESDSIPSDLSWTWEGPSWALTSSLQTFVSRGILEADHPDRVLRIMCQRRLTELYRVKVILKRIRPTYPIDMALALLYEQIDIIDQPFH